MLLLAAAGCVLYLQHGEYIYLAAAGMVFVICAGCILRLPWARSSLRVVAVLIALWALVTGVLMLQQWDAFDRARQHASTQLPQFRDLTLWMIDRAQRTWQFGLALKAVAVPFLLWLAWQLGRPAVRAQFRPGRRVVRPSGGRTL
ncbi:MAG TPA: hypothetical protein VGC19_09485 [Rhodanobacter sp.]